MLAPFRVRSFRFQFPADLLTSWGIEMEMLVLGWYILVETGSVLLLTLFWALQYLGTLLAPVVGMAGDRAGHRVILCAMRFFLYVPGTLLVTVLAMSGALRPIHVFMLAMVSGLLRPSDQTMRNALIAETIPLGQLMPAMGISRTTQDSARMAGSAARRAGLFLPIFGLGAVYVVISTFYLGGFLLTLGVGGARYSRETVNPLRRARDLVDGLAYVWDTPVSLAALWLALLVNLTAFPLTGGLLPYVARDVYHIDQTGLGTLVASFALGSLIGSIVVSFAGRAAAPRRG